MTMKCIKTLLILLACLTLSLSCFTQSATQFLKTPAYIDAATPAWALEMYKEHPNVLEVDKRYNAYHQENNFIKTIHTQNYKHWRPQVEKYLQPSGLLDIPSEKERTALQQKVIEKKNAITRSVGDWTPLGPFETHTDGGDLTVSWQANVYTIDQSQSDPNIVYVGTESGGIFKSIDKGLNWFMVSEKSPIRTVSSIKVDPINPDIVYAGDSGHIFKTVNGGQNWVLMYTEDDLGINDFSINPDNTNIILAASQLGLYRSVDAGLSWDKIIDHRIWDIELKPNDPNTVYVLRSNDARIKTELWKSTDSGVTFEIKENGWYDSSDANRINGGGRMTVTSADPNRIYVILVGASKADDHGFIGVYRSADSGESWTLTNPPIGGPYTDSHPNLATLSNTNTLQQGYYNLGIEASEEDADVLMVGCLNLWRSTDGGETYTVLGGYRGDVSWIHPDQQEIEINGSDMWLVNDGGINYSNDYFATHESRKNGLNASEFWGFGSAWNEDLVVGGRYHNGNSAHRPAYGVGQFLRLGGGEASTGYVQPGGQAVAMFSDISDKIVPQTLTEASQNVSSIALYPAESFFASNWSEIKFDPNSYGHMWLGRENKLYKSEDNGNTFSVIQEFNGEDDPVHQFEISRIDDQLIYLYQRTSFFGAVLWVTRDGGATWTEKDFPLADSQRSGSLQIHENNPETLWVTFAHGLNDGNKVFRSDDYGDTWTNISEPILDGERIHCSFHQAGTDNFFVGTDFGIYLHDGSAWAACNEGLPARLNTNRMAPYYKDNKLRVATYGNGIWEMDLPESATPMAQPTVNQRVALCARDTFYCDDYSILEHDSETSWAWSFTPEPLFVSDPNIRNPKVVLGELGSYSVELTVTNAKGSDTFIKDDWIQVSGNACDPDGHPDRALACYQNGDDYVQLPDVQFTGESYTLMAWVKPEGIQNDFTGIVFNDDASFGLNFTFGNQLGFHHADAGSAAWAWESGAAVEPGVWSHVALVVNTSGATVYLNGEPTSRTLDLEPITLGTMKIGSYKGWGSRNYNGEIDEVSIWDRALTTEEIRNHRHITKTSDNAPGLLAYYQFNESGNTIYDRIGTSHGVLRGITEHVNSSAPVGVGSASSWADAALDLYWYQNENISLTGSLLDGSAITVSHLQIPPANLDVADPFPEDSYWIVNRYGDTEIRSLAILNQEVEQQFEDSPEAISLYSRSENDSESNWTEWGSAESVVSGTGSAIEFSYNELSGQQLIMQKQFVSSSTQIPSQKIQLYPNPTSAELYISAPTEEEMTITIYNSKGQPVMTRKMQNGSRLELMESLSPGHYSYLLKGEKGLKTGKFVVVESR